MSTSLTALTLTAAEAHGEPAVHPYVVGGIAFAILLALLLVLLVVGGGREHS
jgi:hypothetical protein